MVKLPSFNQEGIREKKIRINLTIHESVLKGVELYNQIPLSELVENLLVSWGHMRMERENSPEYQKYKKMVKKQLDKELQIIAKVGINSPQYEKQRSKNIKAGCNAINKIMIKKQKDSNK